MSVTVVVCTHDRLALLERCLKAVRQLDYPAFALTVVDSAPDSEAGRLLAGRYGAGYLVVPVKGVSRARNIGAQSARTDIVAYIDDDMVPHPGWLKSLVAEFSDRRVMAVTGPVLPVTLIGTEPTILQRTLETSSWGPHRFYVDEDCPEWFERANFGGIGDGNMAFRREAIATFSGFDERLGRGAPLKTGEEHYAYFNLIAMGHRVAYSPHAVVFHVSHNETRENRRRALTEAVGYAAFLARRHPRFALRVAKFFCQALQHKQRSWKVAPGAYTADPLSLQEIAMSVMNGLLAFWRAPHERRTRIDPPARSSND